MKGLEATVLRLTEALDANDVWRLDASYFLKEDIRRLHHLLALDHNRIGDKCYVTDGIHTSIDFDEGSGIKVISAKHPKDGFLNLRLVEEISARSHEANPRTALKANDVVISTVGTIGNAAVVRSEALPANSDRHIAIIRTLANERPISPEYLSVFLNCSYGRMQSIRETTGNVQPNLFLVKVRNLKIARFSDVFEGEIHEWSIRSLGFHRDAAKAIYDAERELLQALGLAEWTPPEPLAYTARAADIFAAGRFDARFFAPRIQALLDLLSVDGRTVADVADPRREKFRPDDCAAFDYIEISDIDGAGAATSTRLASEDAPSRATWHVWAGDIITSAVRPIRRLSAQITPEQDGFVCSSGFVVVIPRDITPEVLLTYLRLPVICELLDLYASASMYPAITDADIFNLPLPHIPEAVADQVTQNVIAAKAAKANAARMLETAKRAVEIAIEDGEPAATAYLDQAARTI